MADVIPILPPHEYDPDLSHQILKLIADEISEHRCDVRPDHLYIAEHELILRARAAPSDAPNQVHAYLWAEHERWNKPATVFMLGWDDNAASAAEKIAKDWANGVQPALCKLFHDPRNPPLRLTSTSEDSSQGPVPWRGAVGGVFGWHSGPARMELFPEGYFLHAIVNDVASLLHSRELLSVMAVVSAIDGDTDATVYCDGHIWERASTSLRNAALPISGQIPRAVCQKLYIVLEPCEWNDVARDHYPGGGSVSDSVPNSTSIVPEKPWWKRIIGA